MLVGLLGGNLEVVFQSVADLLVGGVGVEWVVVEGDDDGDGAVDDSFDGVWRWKGVRGDVEVVEVVVVGAVVEVIMRHVVDGVVDVLLVVLWVLGGLGEVNAG